MTIIADKPWFSSIPMRCTGCPTDTDYTGWMICGCTLDMAAAYMRAMTCPKCGAGAEYQRIRTEPDSTLDPS